MRKTLPHPIPYQGSKRKLAPEIAKFLPNQIERFYEPFAGSAAMTIFAARNNYAKRFVISDSLEPLVELLKSIVERPAETVSSYRDVWHGQEKSDFDYFNNVRARYNEGRDPVDLLYLICRCVKNAVRFNTSGNFTQSVDKRRLGMRPNRMESAIFGVSHLLKGRSEFRVGDWRSTTIDARPNDFLYLDPPYLGTSVGKDKRYYQQLMLDELVGGLMDFSQRKLRFIISYDGQTGDKTYGPPLPDDLGLVHLQLRAGRSSQATLMGRTAETVESIYLTPDLKSGRSSTNHQAFQPSLSLEL